MLHDSSLIVIQSNEGRNDFMNSVEAGFRDMTEPAWIERASGFAQAVLKALKIDDWDLSLLFCGDGFMTELNHSYRGKDEPTDVLSFEQGGEYLDDQGIRRFIAGDIVISIDTLERHTKEFSVTADEELRRLIIHGILHLSGKDHADNDSSRPMLVEQEQLLNLLSEERILV